MQYDTRCPLCRTPASKSLAEALGRIQNHSDEGNAEANFLLGDAYRQGGMGLPENFHLACPLYERAAQQGHAGAQFELGQCY
mmetsp:Transcript_1117/g.3506  ORF Transcript_1117/g.3506 Transcript_1117/m.3506 type:complete len:82 (-) Transcript_1117:175-420(-)